MIEVEEEEEEEEEEDEGVMILWAGKEIYRWLEKKMASLSLSLSLSLLCIILRHIY